MTQCETCQGWLSSSHILQGVRLCTCPRGDNPAPKPYSVVDEGMRHYYNRDPDGLRLLLNSLTRKVPS